MLRISRMADYGVTLLAQLAETGPTSAHRLSESSGLPYPTVAKVLKHLASGGVLTSRRGVHGGYTMVRPPSEISVFDVLVAIDGPMHMTENAKADVHWHGLTEKLEAVLREMSVADMLAK